MYHYHVTIDFDSPKMIWSCTDKPLFMVQVKRPTLKQRVCSPLTDSTWRYAAYVSWFYCNNCSHGLFPPGAEWNGCNAEAHPSGWKVAKSAGQHPIWAYPDITSSCCFSMHFLGSELTKWLHSWCDGEAFARYCTNKTVVESMECFKAHF